ncbi:MAG: hypothetical protein QOH41_2121 [Blastocatellia bacterium]|jgi:hypothetical protein|nr:hypothetical protein [Blastocatellia bacterium]
MPFFLVTYEGPTKDDELELMATIQSPAHISFDICYKTYLVRSEMNASELAEFFRSQLESKGKKLANADRLIIAEIVPTNRLNFAWHGPFEQQLQWILGGTRPIPAIRDA